MSDNGIKEELSRIRTGLKGVEIAIYISAFLISMFLFNMCGAISEIGLR